MSETIPVKTNNRVNFKPFPCHIKTSGCFYLPLYPTPGPSNLHDRTKFMKITNLTPNSLTRSKKHPLENWIVVWCECVNCCPWDLASFCWSGVLRSLGPNTLKHFGAHTPRFDKAFVEVVVWVFPWVVLPAWWELDEASAPWMWALMRTQPISFVA